MKHLKRFNETSQVDPNIDFTEHILLSDLLDMCKHHSKYFSKEEKEICSKFLEDNIVTDYLLKLYCLYQIESWGDLYDIVEFIYNDNGPGNAIVIYGKYFNQDYPAKVSFDINEMNTPPKSR